MAASKMRVEELRTELQQRGLITTGTKPTLVRRLEAALRKETQHLTGDADGNARSSRRKRPRDSDNEDSNRSDKITANRQQSLDTDSLNVDDKGAIEEENLVTATKKGAAVLDQWIPDHVKAQYHVLQVGGEIYDAMLNQTNVGDNNNKFYVIQVLEADAGGKFLVYNRWGRVGIKGQDKIHGPYTSCESAIQEFEQKFLAKTKNAWSNRNNFVCHPKSYAWLEMDYSGKDKESIVSYADSVPLVAFSFSSWYNANKLPLGKLSKSTILKGYEVLKRLADVIDKSDRKALEQLSGEIPCMLIINAFAVIWYQLNLVVRNSPWTVREGEGERFRKFSNTKNRMLLWHGSRLTNWTGILSQGLRIAPPEAPVTGYMFGKGVYFADMFSKSANYCYATHTATDGVLLLCEVALGEMAELLTAKYDADKLPEGKLSTKGVGGTAPDFSKAQELEDGVVVPLGKPTKNLGIKGALLYNEYIVYNVEQIRMRYIVHVNFNFKTRR
ncbi:WGR domain [Sesbania bispinosa]|nr:WGR domain [Sesbania bispinosa]